MLRSALVAAALLCSHAMAQTDDSDCAPCGSTPIFAGTYVLATGQIIPPSDTLSDPSSTGVIFNNTCATGYYGQLLNSSTVIDDGRIPSATSLAPITSTLNNYKVNKFEIQYCTKDLTGVFAVRVRFWQKLLGNSTSCTTLAAAGGPTADFTLLNIPGAPATGTLTCYTLAVDLTGFEFCMQGDADAAFNGDAFDNGFGYGLTMLGQTGTVTSAVGGFGICGKVGTCGVGDGTFYSNPTAASATGLDDDVTWYRDGHGGQTSGCFVFSPSTGPVGAAGFYMKIKADLSNCTFCAGNPDDDGDGVMNCVDGCPNDPNKTDPGQCGCGVSDVDSDGDGTSDCNDGCPFDANKLSPGQCGCGVADTDTDGDGTADCNDLCPIDPNKIAPGLCGCGVSDVDSDGDGTPDCNDLCPNDANKIAPGLCGCGVSDVDSDGDGTPDCNDLCPNDANKIAPGLCGCGVSDVDSDGDGTPDCNDLCPNDPNKIAPGQCGCGALETDTDGDGIADCVDNCVSISNPGQEDCNGNSIGDACDLAASFSLDTNGDGIPDECQAGAGVPYCFGDGTGTACPCGNNGAAGSGCANSTGNGALLYNLGGVSVGANDTALWTVRMPNNKFGLVYMGTQNVNAGLPFGDGLRCVKGFIKRFNIRNTGTTGSYSLIGPAGSSNGLINAGLTWYFQSWYRDSVFGACTGPYNLSNALQLDFVP